MAIGKRGMLSAVCFQMATKALFDNHPLQESAERGNNSSSDLNYSSANSAPGVMERSSTEQGLKLKDQL